MKQLSVSLAVLLLLSPLNVLAEEPVSTETPVEINVIENEPVETSSETDDSMNEVVQSEKTADASQEANSIPEPTLEPQSNDVISDEKFLDTTEDERTQEIPALGCDVQEAVACVNEVGYTNLTAAIEAAPANGSVNILKDISLVDGLADDDRYFLNINKSIVINGNNHKITVKNRGIRILGGDTKDNEINVNFKNLTLTNSDSYGRVIDTRGGYFTINIENSCVEATGSGNVQPITIGGDHSHLNTVNIVDSIISGANEAIKDNNAGYGFTIFNPVNLNITRSTVNGYAALYFKGPNSSAGSNGSKVTIVDSELNGLNVHTSESGSSFGTIVLEEGNINISLENSTVKAKATNSATQSAINLSDNAADLSLSNVTFTNNSTIIVEGENAQVANEEKTDHLTFISANSNTNLRSFISDDQASVGIETNDGTKYYVDTKENINSIVSTQENIHKIEVVSGITELNNIPSGVVVENTSNNTIAINGNVVNKDENVIVPFELTEEIKNGTSELFGTNTIYFNGHFYSKLTDALTAAYMANTNYENVLYCKKNADVGAMTHGHVADNMTIYGNGAFVSGGERDLEIDTNKYDRITGKQNQNGVYLDKDITVNVYDLDGIAAWGERHTDFTVNLNFVNCKSMQRIYFTNNSNKKGIININLDNCTFEKDGKSSTGASIPSNVGTSIYSNSDGEIVVKNSKFIGIDVPLNLNHKSLGTQTVKVSNTQFIDCGQGSEQTKTYAAPIRVVSTKGARTDLIVDSVQFMDTDGIKPSNGDILLGDGRKAKGTKQGITTLTMTNTKADVMVQESGYYNKDNTANPDLAKTTSVAQNQTLKPSDKNHFILNEDKPVSPSKDDNKPVSTWDNGGPFTTDACGNVFDRWGNEIYHAPVCASKTNSNYTFVNTSDK